MVHVWICVFCEGEGVGSCHGHRSASDDFAAALSPAPKRATDISKANEHIRAANKNPVIEGNRVPIFWTIGSVLIGWR